MSFHTIKKCIIHVDGKKYTKNEIKIGDNLLFIHYSKPDYRGYIKIELKKPPNKNKELEPAPALAKQVDIKEYDGNNFVLRFTWKGLWEDEDTGKESTKSLDFKIKFERSIDGERVYLAIIGKPLDGKYKIKGSPRKTKRKKVKKSLRKGPSESATKFKVGTIKKGNDNNMWKIVVNKKGIQRWQKISNKQNGGLKPPKYPIDSTLSEELSDMTSSQQQLYLRNKDKQRIANSQEIKKYDISSLLDEDINRSKKKVSL